MTVPYPIVDQRSLAPVPPKRLLGPKRTRGIEEIPQTAAGQRLIYRIDGDFLLDNSALPLDSTSVLDATHVSVVDVSSDVEVFVELDIPSKDADKFTMRLTFVCTVTDPIAVVRQGSPSAASALRAYIKSHHRIFELGLDYPLAEINTARLKLNAQVKAFTTVEPPTIVGVSVELASVEVLTPTEVSEFEQSMRQQEQHHRIQFGLQRSSQVLQHHKAEFEYVTAAEAQRAELERDADMRGYQRYQFTEQSRVVPNDALSALTNAYSVGDISAKELAERVTSLEADKLEYERAQAQERLERERTESRELAEWKRENKRLRWEAHRTDTAEEWLYRRRELEIKRERELRNREWSREDLAIEREDKRRELEAKIDIVRELAQRGYLDTANVNLEKVVDNMLAGTREQANPESAELTDLKAPELEAADNDEEANDEEEREEDVH
ncbi:hypothetical protein [Actinophytocola glycyrrhizae]|uniref:Band 7 domain-containing protein n=1 Tax=Actinophytocola glycyrrhizae TaxID=2044873 RepID=A0ABV9RZ06_9PSEU